MSRDFTAGKRSSRRAFLGAGAAGLAVAGTTAFTKTDPKVTATLTAVDQEQLGLLANLAGTWEGTGFSLISRPDFHDQADTYLQLNQTRETLTITPIGATIPNRGFGQDDIDLFGLNYLQRIEDAATGAQLHLEPGLWMTQPQTSYPLETADPGEQIIFRMGSIPHGTTLLAEGVAATFDGPPTLGTSTAVYASSAFPSFNSTPFAVGTAIPAAGTSASADDDPLVARMKEFDINVPASQANPRTPYRTDPPEPPLPASIDGVPMQTVVNDPITLLQAVIKRQVAQGYTFSGVAVNIATQEQITFLAEANKANGPTTTISLTDGGGSLGNIPFLLGETSKGPNAQSALFYATFWIEQVNPPNSRPFMQLQYVQFAQLNFGIRSAQLLPKIVANAGWPHISVATLRKSFR